MCNAWICDFLDPEHRTKNHKMLAPPPKKKIHLRIILKLMYLIVCSSIIVHCIQDTNVTFAPNPPLTNLVPSLTNPVPRACCCPSSFAAFVQIPHRTGNNCGIHNLETTDSDGGLRHWSEEIPVYQPCIQTFTRPSLTLQYS